MSTKSKVTVSVYGLCTSILVFIYGLKAIYLIAHNGSVMRFLDIIEWPFYLILIGLMIRKKMYQLKELIVLVVLGLILLFVYYYSGFASLFKAFVVIVAAKEVSFDRLVKSIRNSYCIIFIVAVLLFVLGFSNAGMQRRGYFAYGFITTNLCGEFFLIICLLLLLNKNYSFKKKIAVSWAFAFMTFFFINHRSVAILLFTAPLVEYVIVKLLGKKKIPLFKLFMYSIPGVAIGLSIVTAVLYPTNSLIQKLNIIISSRIYLNYSNMQQFGIHLFAQDVHFVSGANVFNSVTGTYSTFNTVDSAYMCLILQMGIVAACMYFVAHFLLCKRLFEEKNSTLLMLVLLIGIYGLFESSVLEIYINIPMIYLLTRKDEIAI